MMKRRKSPRNHPPSPCPLETKGSCNKDGDHRSSWRLTGTICLSTPQLQRNLKPSSLDLQAQRLDFPSHPNQTTSEFFNLLMSEGEQTSQLIEDWHKVLDNTTIASLLISQKLQCKLLSAALPFLGAPSSPLSFHHRTSNSKVSSPK